MTTIRYIKLKARFFCIKKKGIERMWREQKGWEKTKTRCILINIIMEMSLCSHCKFEIRSNDIRIQTLEFNHIKYFIPIQIWNVFFEWIASSEKQWGTYILSNTIQQPLLNCIRRRVVYILGDAFNIRRWSLYTVKCFTASSIRGYKGKVYCTIMYQV